MILADYPQQKEELKLAEGRINRAKDALAQMKVFETRIREIKTRVKDIKDLYRFRRTWAPLLHQMSAPEVLPANIWYREIEFKPGKSLRGKTAPEELILRGYARGTSDKDGAISMNQATQAISAFVGNLQALEDFMSEFVGDPEKIDATKITALSPPKGAPASVPREAAAFGIKLDLKPKKASKGNKADKKN